MKIMPKITANRECDFRLSIAHNTDKVKRYYSRIYIFLGVIYSVGPYGRYMLFTPSNILRCERYHFTDAQPIAYFNTRMFTWIIDIGWLRILVWR